MTILQQKPEGCLDREVVAALAMLSALEHYFPSYFDQATAALTTRFDYVKTKEPSRWIKQRRIGLAKILQELNHQGT